MSERPRRETRMPTKYDSESVELQQRDKRVVKFKKDQPKKKVGDEVYLVPSTNPKKISSRFNITVKNFNPNLPPALFPTLEWPEVRKPVAEEDLLTEAQIALSDFYFDSLARDSTPTSPEIWERSPNSSFREPSPSLTSHLLSVGGQSGFSYLRSARNLSDMLSNRHKTFVNGSHILGIPAPARRDGGVGFGRSGQNIQDAMMSSDEEEITRAQNTSSKLTPYFVWDKIHPRLRLDIIENLQEKYNMGTGMAVKFLNLRGDQREDIYRHYNLQQQRLEAEDQAFFSYNKAMLEKLLRPTEGRTPDFTQSDSAEVFGEHFGDLVGANVEDYNIVTRAELTYAQTYLYTYGMAPSLAGEWQEPSQVDAECADRVRLAMESVANRNGTNDIPTSTCALDHHIDARPIVPSPRPALKVTVDVPPSQRSRPSPHRSSVGSQSQLLPGFAQHRAQGILNRKQATKQSGVLSQNPLSIDMATSGHIQKGDVSAALSDINTLSLVRKPITLAGQMPAPTALMTSPRKSSTVQNPDANGNDIQAQIPTPMSASPEALELMEALRIASLKHANTASSLKRKMTTTSVLEDARIFKNLASDTAQSANPAKYQKWPAANSVVSSVGLAGSGSPFSATPSGTLYVNAERKTDKPVKSPTTNTIHPPMRRPDDAEISRPVLTTLDQHEPPVQEVMHPSTPGNESQRMDPTLARNKLDEAFQTLMRDTRMTAHTSKEHFHDFPPKPPKKQRGTKRPMLGSTLPAQEVNHFPTLAKNGLETSTVTPQANISKMKKEIGLENTHNSLRLGASSVEPHVEAGVSTNFRTALNFDFTPVKKSADEDEAILMAATTAEETPSKEETLGSVRPVARAKRTYKKRGSNQSSVATKSTAETEITEVSRRKNDQEDKTVTKPKRAYQKKKSGPVVTAALVNEVTAPPPVIAPAFIGNRDLGRSTDHGSLPETNNVTSALKQASKRDRKMLPPPTSQPLDHAPLGTGKRSSSKNIDCREELPTTKKGTKRPLSILSDGIDQANMKRTRNTTIEPEHKISDEFMLAGEAGINIELHIPKCQQGSTTRSFSQSLPSSASTIYLAKEHPPFALGLLQGTSAQMSNDRSVQSADAMVPIEGEDIEEVSMIQSNGKQDIAGAGNGAQSAQHETPGSYPETLAYSRETSIPPAIGNRSTSVASRTSAASGSSGRGGRGKAWRKGLRGGLKKGDTMQW